MSNKSKIIEELDNKLNEIPGEVCLVFLKRIEEFNSWFPGRSFIICPEKDLSVDEQCSFMYDLQKQGLNQQLIITSSPFIISDFKKEKVLVCDGNEIKHPNIETYGANPDIILFHVFKLQNLIGKRALNDVKALNKHIKVENDMTKIKEESRKFGESVEKTLLFRAIIMRESEINGTF